MFQYASLLGIAARQNRVIISSSNGNESSLERYLVNVQVKPGAAHCQGVAKITESACCRLDRNAVNLDKDKNYEIEGFLRSRDYFKDYEELIRKSLTFQNSILHKARKIIEGVMTSHNISMSKVILVGVHVHRSNRVKDAARVQGYQVAPKEYFHRAMDHFRKKYQNGPRSGSKSVLFIVVSEDHAWVNQNLLGPKFKDVIVVPSHEPETDMALLTLLDHVITSVGSFSWWVAYLNKGDVVYYKYPIAKVSSLMADYGGTLCNYFSSSWKAME